MVSYRVYEIGFTNLCTPGMGVNLWGESPLYMNPVPLFYDGNESTSRRQAAILILALAQFYKGTFPKS